MWPVSFAARRPQAADDRQQDRIGQEIAGEWRAAQGRGEEPRCISPYALPLGSSIRARLAYDFFRFLRRPLRLRKWQKKRHVKVFVVLLSIDEGRRVGFRCFSGKKRFEKLLLLMKVGDVRSAGRTQLVWLSN